MEVTEPASVLKTFDYRDDESVASAVIDAVSELEDRELDEIDPLYYAIDPDAINALFGRPDGPTASPNATVEFLYGEYCVRLEPGGIGRIYEAPS